jgi:hypothetical protein
VKLWTAYKCLGDDYQPRLFTVLASLVARHRGIEVGLISSKEDRTSLKSCGFRCADFIEADLPGATGAEIKLNAIAEHIPDGDALIDGDVFLTKLPDLDPATGWALNYEPLRLYRQYASDEMAVVQKCWPQGERTINAGLLYLPPDSFRDYARQALDLSRQIKCIGHTYEQMFFVRYCQNRGIELRAVYPHSVHTQREVEAMYQASGIRHPFCYKSSLLEAQRAIDLAMEHADPRLVRAILKRFWPAWAEMADRKLFRPL